MKPKPPRQPDGQLMNLSISSCSKFCNTDPVKGKVWELERQLKMKDEELIKKEHVVHELQEKFTKQTLAIAEITEELQSKCVQLNKLQDVISSHSANSLPPTIKMLTGSPTTKRHISPSRALQTSPFKTLSGFFNNSKRKGAKEGVSAEPTTRTYDQSNSPKFSFEKACVRKDSR